MKKHILYLFLFIATLAGCKKETARINLDVQFKALKTLAESQPCTNAAEWRITPVGAKACGGPAGYMAYSARIDTTAFLQQVNDYTEAQKKYNRDNGVASDCALAVRPNAVQCSNGKPVLIY